MSVGRLIERGLIGGLFIGHGTQKLYGWFGGPGRAGTEGMMASLQMHPAKANALAAGITEAGGGALIAAGLATPAAAAALTGVMTTAIKKVHLPNGPWAANGGWEYNAVLIAAVIALAEVGPGELSLDHVFGLDDIKGPKWALAALALGIGSAFATMAVAQRMAPTEAPGAGPAEEAALGETAGDPATAGS
jgi:putative oxidoreductase